MMLTTIDVILRKVSTFSILGSYEITEMSMVVLVFLGIAALQVKKGHVRVEMLINRIPSRGAHFITFVFFIAEALLYGDMIYAVILKLQELSVTPLLTSTLFIPYAPFYVIMAIGLTCFVILLFMDAIIQLQKGITGAHIDEKA
jgi:TRAP-type C4-dicarboxylate transport system permease small subunit